MRIRTSVVAVAALSLWALLPSRLAARAQDRLKQGVDDGREVVLRGNVHPRAQALNDQGRVGRLTVLPRIVMHFQPTAEQQADLENLLREQQDPASPNYHRWLTPEQFGSRFGLSDSDFSKVTDWLESRGITIVERSRSRTYVAFRASVGQIDTVFRTEIHRYRVDAEEHFANANDPSIPANLAGVVRGFHGLHDFHPQSRSISVQSRFTSGISGNHFIAPRDFATLYNLQPLYKMGIDGTGQVIAIVGQSNINLSDIATFRSVSGLPPIVPQVILIPGSPDPGTADIDEASLDLEWSGAVARNANLIYVNSNDAFGSMQYAIANNVAPVLSVSYGLCERFYFPSNVAELDSFATNVQQANAQGMTILAASGDTGAADCKSTTALSVDVPAAIPNVTGVGGTSLDDGGGTFGTAYWSATNDDYNGSALSYIPEIAWHDSSTAASGGGASLHFPKPAWQVAAGVPNDNARDVPDVALPASGTHPGYLICSAGSCVNGYRRADDTLNVVGGTSVGAPAFAGIVALINQFTGTSQGNINPRLYQLPALSSDVFHDVISGNNGGYTAGPGYDQVTGLGSPNAYNLVTQWVPVAFSPNPVRFGNRLPNISTTLSVNLRNNNAATLNVGSIGISGNFAQTNDCPGTLTYGASCTISVTFLPTSLGQQTGTLTVATDASGSPHQVPISGSGSDLAVTLARPDRAVRSEANLTPVAQATQVAARSVAPTSDSTASAARPRLAAATSVVQVSPVRLVWNGDEARTVTVTNLQPAPVTIAIEMGGGFQQENDCGAEMKAGASCEVKVTKTSGAEPQGEIKITSPAGTTRVPISGGARQK